MTDAELIRGIYERDGLRAEVTTLKIQLHDVTAQLDAVTAERDALRREVEAWKSMRTALVSLMAFAIFLFCCPKAHGREVEVTIETMPEMYWDEQGELHNPGLLNPYPHRARVRVEDVDDDGTWDGDRRWDAGDDDDD